MYHRIHKTCFVCMLLDLALQQCMGKMVSLSSGLLRLLCRWDSGETYLIMDQPMSAVAERLAQGLTIRTEWPVSSIRYDAGEDQWP